MGIDLYCKPNWGEFRRGTSKEFRQKNCQRQYQTSEQQQALLIDN